MPRDLRPQEAGLTYHITSRGNRRGAIYEDDADRRYFLEALANTVARHKWTCHAYCLMTTHYHLLVTTAEPNIALGMQMLNGLHAQYYNRRYKLSGHLFQGRYHSVVAANERHLLELFRYIALNPVRAGICAAPEEWRWSSYRHALGLDPKPRFLAVDFLLECFADDPVRARALLHEFVEAREDSSPTARASSERVLSGHGARPQPRTGV